MSKFTTLRKINRDLKYHPIEEYIGIEIPINISNGGEAIVKDIKLLIEENLNLKVKSFKGNNVEGTIAKYGLIDVSFEVETKIETNNQNGPQVLRDNAWVDKDSDEEFKEAGLEFLADMIIEIEENKTYLKIYATSTHLKKRRLKEKAYLLRQVLNGEKMNPSSEDKIQVFRIKDMCYTNYSGIWLWKYFYM